MSNPQNPTAMTATFQTARFFAFDNENTTPRNPRSHRPALHLYQADVQDFDNEYESYEIEAASFEEAAAIAESRFGSNAYNINLYLID